MRYEFRPLAATGAAACPWCQRTFMLTTEGRFRYHFEWRVSRGGRPYRSNDRCQASGLTLDEARKGVEG